MVWCGMYRKGNKMNWLDIITTFFKANVSNIYKFLAIFIVFIISLMMLYINSLRAENKILNTDLILANAKNVTLNASIDYQNQKINKNRVDLEKNLKELEEWKNKPPDIKYQTVIKFKEVKSNECEDIKNTIDAIRSTSF